MNARTRQSLRWSACLVRGGPGAVLSQALNVRCENSADDRFGADRSPPTECEDDLR